MVCGLQRAGYRRGVIYGLLAAAADASTMSRALEIVEQLPDIRAASPLPVREAQTLAMELLMQRALERGLETAILDSPSYRRYAEQYKPKQKQRRTGLPWRSLWPHHLPPLSAPLAPGSLALRTGGKPLN